MDQEKWPSSVIWVFTILGGCAVVLNAGCATVSKFGWIKGPGANSNERSPLPEFVLGRPSEIRNRVAESKS